MGIFGKKRDENLLSTNNNEDIPYARGLGYGQKTWGAAIKSQLVPTSGDINAMFSILLDNLANIASLVAILVYSFGMPMDLVSRYFIPGAALSVMLGSLSLSAYSIYLDFHERDPSVLYTSIPIGLDAPSTIGLPLLVIGPTFQRSKALGKSDYDATIDAWLVGCTTVFLIGLVKILLSLLSFAQKQFHPVGKAGALAGIGLALLGMNQLLTVLQDPVTGWVSLWILLLLLLQRVNKHGQSIFVQLPFNISGVLVSAVIGSIIYYFMAGLKISVVPMPTGIFDNYQLSYPRFANIFTTFSSAIKHNISIAIPYAILVNIGGLTITDAAIGVGNRYNTRVILLLDSAVTIIGSLFGSATQTTPYIGHTVFHSKFKARSGYSFFTGLIIGLGGFFGYISLLTSILPKPAIIPIFIFIAFEICADTIHTTSGIKKHHIPAIIWSFFPALFQFVNIILSQISPVLANAVVNPELVMQTLNLPSELVSNIGVIQILSHGFICTSLFWGTTMGFLLDDRLKRASIFFGITAFLTFFGVIHSVNPNGEVYVPWQSGSYIPYHWTISYVLLAGITLAFSYYKSPNEENNGTNPGTSSTDISPTQSYDIDFNQPQNQSK